ncbi:MAG TPA: signal peptidase I [Caulobacteraceae bacterium]|jgi:signal peptidase I|nr:signal peptidase I [Caulobacteraceae bacterium]
MTDAAEPSAEPETLLAQIKDIAKTVGAALLVTLVLRVVVFQPFTIPSDSMEPLLLKGDYLILWKGSYGWSRYSIPFDPPLFHGRLFDRSPKRGDVVVFKHEMGGKRTDYIKRVIGLPGDRVQVITSRLYINGAAVKRQILGPATDPDDPSRRVTRVRESLPDGRRWITFIEDADREGETTGVYVVPKDRLFVMGDNRDNSLDSRWPQGVGMGFIPKDEVEGRAAFVLASWRGGASLWKPWTWFTRFNPTRMFKSLG